MGIMPIITPSKSIKRFNFEMDSENDHTINRPSDNTPNK